MVLLMISTVKWTLMIRSRKLNSERSALTRGLRAQFTNLLDKLDRLLRNENRWTVIQWGAHFLFIIGLKTLHSSMSCWICRGWLTFAKVRGPYFKRKLTEPRMLLNLAYNAWQCFFQNSISALSQSHQKVVTFSAERWFTFTQWFERLRAWV